MALTKAQKQEQIESLQAELRSATTLVLAGFTGLTVDQDYELRKQVRAAGGRYRVVKNSLAERAAIGTPAASVIKQLSGVHSIAYTSGDGVALAKALQKYAKDNPGFSTKAAVVEGQTINAAEIVQLAALPSRDELFAKLLFLLQAPAQRLVTVVNAVGRNLAVVVDQGVKNDKFAGGAAAADSQG